MPVAHLCCSLVVGSKVLLHLAGRMSVVPLYGAVHVDAVVLASDIGPPIIVMQLCRYTAQQLQE
jgi:hypothetical protein